MRRRPSVARRGAIGVALAALACLAALGPRYGGRVSVGVLDLSSEASPTFTLNRGARLLAALRHETLVTIDAVGALTPSLAEHWSTSADGREWTLDLAETARFHDERPVTVEDALRSLRRFLRSNSPAAAVLAAQLEGGGDFRRGATETLSGLASAAPRRVVLRMANPGASPLTPLAAPAAAITSTEGAGCGPFAPAHIMRGERATLMAFDQHVRGRPFVDNVELVRYPDPAALRLALEQGAVQAVVGDGRGTPLVARLLLLLDREREAFRGLAARRRVAEAIDRDLLVRRFLPGGQPTCRLVAAVAHAPCDSPLRSAPAPAAATAIVLNVDSSIDPLTSQRVVAHLVALGHRVRVVVLSPDAVVSSPADARLLLWCPEVDDALLALHELALLSHALNAPEQAALAVESTPTAGRPTRDELERSILATHTVLPLAVAPLAAIGPKLIAARVTTGGLLLLEDVWLPL